MPLKKFGFPFWLSWIVWFVVSFIFAAIFWTVLVTRSFGNIQEPEIVITWAIAVFGSWFLLITPFMRKKEQIWKRLNQDQEKAVDAALLGMGLFVGLLVASCFFWTWKMKAQIADDGRMNGPWLKAVVGTWLVLLLPFLIVLYKNADKIFKEAIVRQTSPGPPFQSIFVEKSQRLLPDAVSSKLKEIPPTLDRGHLVSLILKDGRKIPDVFILDGKEILGIYDRIELGFNVSDILDAEPLDHFQNYEESKWLRLDGKV